MPDNVLYFLGIITFISIALAVFNLIPISPLDGSHILSSLLPLELAKAYDRTMGRYGLLIFLGLIMLSSSRFNVLGMILGPPVKFLLHFFMG